MRVSLTGVEAKSSVTWVASGKETKRMKPAYEAIFETVSESPGRNESEPTGGLEKNNSGGRVPSSGAKAAQPLLSIVVRASNRASCLRTGIDALFRGGAAIWKSSLSMMDRRIRPAASWRIFGRRCRLRLANYFGGTTRFDQVLA